MRESSSSLQNHSDTFQWTGNLHTAINRYVLVCPHIHAIAWMARDMHGYQLLRAMPSLLEQFEGCGNMMSRKRPLDE